MNYLPTMSQDEIRYVCSVIPIQETVGYFKRYPKDFNKVIRGIRATSLKNQEQVSSILFRSRKQLFISSFIEKHISRWLEEIGIAIKEKIDEGKSKEYALIQTLPHCFFADNINLYFKLIGEEYAEDFLMMLSTSIKVIKEIDAENERVKSKLDAKTLEAVHLNTEIEHIQIKQDQITRVLSERTKEIEILKHTNVYLAKNNEVIALHEQKIRMLEQKVQEREHYIQQLKVSLSTAINEQLRLEQTIKEETKKIEQLEKHRQNVTQKPKRPKDLDEFRDYLGYNFENIGVPANTDYYSLLKKHLSVILFQGKPIIISRCTGLSLMQCVSNTLVKTSVVSTLTYADDITEKSIDNFLLQDKRIVCLDNFIGNYNETVLITICDRHKDKIIFLTVAYDRTIAYVPDELLRYCHYLNLNRIEAFIGGELTEDPSVVDEEETAISTIAPGSRWSVMLNKILGELGVRGALAAYKGALISDELSLCCQLAFDVLPYCADVLKIAPFNVSEQLVKYTGVSGRCPYKDLLRRWFSC